MITEPAAAHWFGRVIAGIASRKTSERADRQLQATGTSDERDEFFVVLGHLLDATPTIDVSPVPGCGFALGWVGHLGYELGRESGGPVRFADGHPDGMLRFVDRAVVIDARDEVSWVLALVDDIGSAHSTSRGASAANRTWMAATAHTVEMLSVGPVPAVPAVPPDGGPVRSALLETGVVPAAPPETGAVPTAPQDGGAVLSASLDTGAVPSAPLDTGTVPTEVESSVAVSAATVSSRLPARGLPWAGPPATTVPSAGARSNGPSRGVTVPDLPATILPADGRVSRAQYERDVDACRTEIREGNAFQVCLTTSFTVMTPWETARTLRTEVFGGQPTGAHPTDAQRAGDQPARAHPVDASALGTGGPGSLADDPAFDEYLRLRIADPVPFGSFMRLGRVTIASRSPERFLAVSASGRVVAEPIKGTRPRGETPAQDDVLREGLAASAKDRAENVMIVDLLRNDLQRTAVPGSVHVERLCAIESYATVHQMVSTVVGSVRPGVSVEEVVRAAFPPGSMTGAPKISAMAIAARLEKAPRGVYAGAIGYFSMNGAVDLAVAIRTLVTVLRTDAGGGNGAHAPRGPDVVRSLGAGGAVTWSSSAQEEADEVETKTRSVLGALGSAATW